MKHLLKLRGVLRNEAERVALIKGLKAIEELARGFQVGLDSQSHANQFFHLGWRTDGQCLRSDASERKITPNPDRQAADHAFFKGLILLHGANDLGHVIFRSEE